jgi:thiosulfate/3-mercaptopyruvate sulfurtransferase
LPSDEVFANALAIPMKIKHLPLIAIIIWLSTCAELNAQRPHEKWDLLVSTDWLAEHMEDSSVLILHYGMNTEFKKGHIPGARLVSIWDVLVKNENGLRHELPGEQKLEQVLRSWGINNNSKIIISYQDGNSIPMAARLFYTLDYAGLGKQVYILNGGFQAWQEEGKVAIKDEAEKKVGHVDIMINDQVRITKEEVLKALQDEEVKIVDARPSERYYGTIEDNSSGRQGHIQGAINIPFFETTRVDSTHLFKTLEELQDMFDAYKIPKGSKIITYCGTGIWASPLYFTFKLLEYEVRFYDGSFQEWGNDESLPIE